MYVMQCVLNICHDVALALAYIVAIPCRYRYTHYNGYVILSNLLCALNNVCACWLSMAQHTYLST